MSAYVAIDVTRAEALAARAVQGNASAWRTLVTELWPALSCVVRASPSMGLLARDEDHVRDVLVRLFEKLGKDGHRSLALYVPWREQHPEKDFGDWIRIVTANVVRDHMRDLRGDDAAFGEPAKRLLDEVGTSPAVEKLGVRPPITDAQMARQLMEFAEAKLPMDQWRALVLWVEGAGFEDIEAELGLKKPEVARGLVRAAVAVLRRAFVGGQPRA